MDWTVHTIRKEAAAIEKTALDWNPQGYRRRGRSKRTWRRTTDDEIRNTGRSWNEVKEIAGDRNAWKLFMDALCSTRSKRTRWLSTCLSHDRGLIMVNTLFCNVTPRHWVIGSWRFDTTYCSHATSTWSTCWTYDHLLLLKSLRMAPRCRNM